MSPTLTQNALLWSKPSTRTREQWQPERGFHRFKRGHLPALAIYFQDEERIRGLMFLLTRREADRARDRSNAFHQTWNLSCVVN